MLSHDPRDDRSCSEVGQMVLGKFFKACSERLRSETFFLATTFRFLDFRINALAQVLPPLTRNLPSLCERHRRIVANPPRDGVCAAREARDQHKRAFVIVPTALCNP